MKVIPGLGLENAKEVTKPAVKRSVSNALKADRESQRLDDEKVKTYRIATMKIMHLSMDRPDISYAASTQASHMKEPRENNMEELKRIGRYLKKCPAGRPLFPSQGLPDKISAYCDSDYAGDPITRRSRTGMALQWGSHLLKHGSTAQSTVRLSSGEA
eukprot:3024060-Pyramimonas_sp.AAC.1